MRLAGVVLHALERGLEGRPKESAVVRQVRLVVDAASCSESDAVRSFLMDVAERAGTREVTDAAPGSAPGSADVSMMGSMADELVDLVDDGVEEEEDAEEVRRLVAGLGAACGWDDLVVQERVEAFRRCQ